MVYSHVCKTILGIGTVSCRLLRRRIAKIDVDWNLIKKKKHWAISFSPHVFKRLQLHSIFYLGKGIN